MAETARTKSRPSASAVAARTAASGDPAIENLAAVAMLPAAAPYSRGRETPPDDASRYMLPPRSTGRGSAANAGPCRAASAEGVRAARMRKANTVMIDTVAPRVPSPLAAACAAESLAGFQLLGHKTSNGRTLPRGTCQSLRTTPLHANTTPEFSREHGKLHSVRGRRGGRARSAVREPKATAAQGSGWACVRVPYALACDTIPPLLPPHAYAPTRRRRICRHSALPMRPA